MEKFTFCITSKNNRRYLEYAIKYIKENSAIDHDILVFIDADDDNSSEWCKENNITFIKNNTGHLYGIGNAYNLLVEESKTDFVVIYHADMIMAKDFDIELYKLWKPKTVVSATRIEPPLHNEDPSKITINFGLWPEQDIEDGFNKDAFFNFTEHNKSNKITKGIFAPWLIHKDDFLRIGGHDPIMKSHSEDRDLFNRFLLSGYDIIQSWSAFVYHLTCRGGQFEHANKTSDLNTKSQEWRQLEHRQTREFIRKWGSTPKYDEFQYPIVLPKYNIVFKITNCSYELLEALEPWCDKIYNDCPRSSEYVKKEQPNTIYDLSKRVLKIAPDNDFNSNDILVEIDGSNFTQRHFELIQHLPLIIKESGEIGRFNLEDFILTINKIEELQTHLIKLLK